MKTSGFLAMALFAALTFTGASAFADDNGKGKDHAAKREARRERRFEKMDANHDGVVSKDEFLAFKAEHHHCHHKDGTSENTTTTK